MVRRRPENVRLKTREKIMSDLPKRILGRTGMEVTVLSYGAMELRGSPRRETSDAQAETILNAVLDSGINYIDTSIDYGVAEERIGRFLAHRRQSYFLASKCGCQAGAENLQGGQPHNYTRENIIAGVEQSLRRMKTDYLDLVQIHISPSRAVLEENGSVEAMLDLQKAGKVRFIGMSGTLPHIWDHIAMGVFDVFQIPYSAAQREHEAAISAAAKAGAGIVIRGGTAKGGPRAGQRDEQQYLQWQQAKLDELLGGMTQVEFILRFTISHPDMHTTIVGTANPDHLRDNLDTVRKGPLPADLYAEAKRRLADVGFIPEAA